MTFEETLDYLYNSLPMFHRIGEPAFKPSLDNTLELCSLVDNPQHKFKSIHIAGTNGKGSSSHMLASILQSSGYKTGLFTSPHLKCFTERIKVDGVDISKEWIIDFVSKFRNDFERIKPSFFEMTVALAFDYFAKQKVDIAVIEVGLGGRLDSTNIITPLVSLITNISFDHENILGNTLPLIASEKAGIIKQNIPVVISEKQEGVYPVFEEKAKQFKADLTFGDQYNKVENARLIQGKFVADVFQGGELKFKELELDLGGSYQSKNLAGVLTVVDILNLKGLSITNANIRDGLASVVAKTGLKGRWQMLNQQPLTICDTGHNEAGIRYVTEQINSLTYKNLYFVLGTVNDKDIDKILKLLPKNAFYYFTMPNIPRGLEVNILAEKASQFGLNGKVISKVIDAIVEAKKNADKDDLIFIGGSNFVVAEIEEL